MITNRSIQSTTTTHVKVRRSGRAIHGPAWRLVRAVHLLNTQAQPDAADDPHTRRLLRLLQLRGGLRPYRAPHSAGSHFPYLELALQIFMDDSDRRLIIENGFNTGLGLEELARWTALQVPIISAYAGFFYDQDDHSAIKEIDPDPHYSEAG